MPSADLATASGAPTVDVHAHALLAEVESLVAGRPQLAALRALETSRNGAASMEASGRMVGQRIPLLTEPPVRLAAMDRVGVDVQVVSPSPSQYHYWADEVLAQELYQVANQSVADLCASAPGRLVGLGLVPLQHPSLVVDALDHAMGDCGLAGVEISSHHADLDTGAVLELSDPGYEPLWARAEELSAVVFIHPFGCTLGSRLDKWYLANIVGQPVENAVALSHLIFSGVLDRHPGLRLLAAHGGGYLPGHIGRSDHGWRVRPESHTCAAEPSSYLRRMWFDSLVHSPEALRHLVEATGADRVLLGSDFPFDMGVEDPLGHLRAAGLTPSEMEAIRSSNAIALGLGLGLGLSPLHSPLQELPHA